MVGPITPSSANGLKERPCTAKAQGESNGAGIPASLSLNYFKLSRRPTRISFAIFLLAWLGIATAQPNESDDKKKAEILIDEDSLAQPLGNCRQPPQVTTRPPGLEYEITFPGTEGRPNEPGIHRFIVTITEPGWEGMVEAKLVLVASTAALIIDTVHEYDGEPKSVTIKTQSHVTQTKVRYRPDGSDQAWSQQPPSGAGRYDVSAKVFIDSCLLGRLTGSLRIKKGDQEIDFPSIRDKHVNEAPFELNAKADSGLDVRYSVTSGPAEVCGNTVTSTGKTGSVVLRARQPGNENWKPAEPAERSFEVLPKETPTRSSLKLQLSKSKITITVDLDQDTEFVIERTEDLFDPKWDTVGTTLGRGSLCLDRDQADTAFFRARPSD